MNPPRIGVVIPVYNSAQYLPDLFSSLRRQTLPAAEVLVVDDGSDQPHETGDICAAHGFNCMLRPHERQGAARNFGEAHLSPAVNYLYFADSDSVVAPDAFELMHHQLQAHPEAGYCYADFMEGHVIKHWFDFNGERLIQSNYIDTGSLLRREVFKPFDVHVKALEDWELFLRLYLVHGITGVWLDHITHLSKARPGRVSHAGHIPESMEYVRRKLWGFRKNHGVSR
ncbi:MAG: glycosyltransferase family A protein [bacterium]